MPETDSTHSIDGEQSIKHNNTKATQKHDGSPTRTKTNLNSRSPLSGTPGKFCLNRGCRQSRGHRYGRGSYSFARRRQRRRRRLTCRLRQGGGRHSLPSAQGVSCTYIAQQSRARREGVTSYDSVHNGPLLRNAACSNKSTIRRVLRVGFILGSSQVGPTRPGPAREIPIS